ncbi:helix-turn-helix domain-containing protein [Chitinophaga sp. 30R24]|uniref:helix-turn-helix domain-containing protein n=1 Tax=Chitinophaga sp. 30R24 TaxID=3248838 RepID=UPI003B8FDF68
MSFYQYTPRIALSAFIRVYRIGRFVFDNHVPLPFKPYPPRPEHCLCFYPNDTEQVEYTYTRSKAGRQKIALIGQHTEVINRYVGRNFLMFQIVFQPGALYRLTGIPSQELFNAYIDAETVFPNSISGINEKLGEAAGNDEMIAIVEDFLFKLINRPLKDIDSIDRLSATILESPNMFSVDYLAKESCLSLRQFERRCKARMGVSPKAFINLVRFSNVNRMKNKYPDMDWFTLAIHCGYYDLQHLIKDYKKFSLLTPGDFFKLELECPERKLGIVDAF